MLLIHLTSPCRAMWAWDEATYSINDTVQRNRSFNNAKRPWFLFEKIMPLSNLLPS